MKRSQRSFNIFSLSFLDVISCGFGAVILLVLVTNDGTSPAPDIEAKAEVLLQSVLAAEKTVEELRQERETTDAAAASKATLLERLKAQLERAQRNLADAKGRLENLTDDTAGLELVEKTLEKTSATTEGGKKERDEEVGGIPIDSDYVVFIVDTSGSMQEIWGRVTAQIENIIKIHPKIKGFQILNDNGVHILSGFEGRWIPDTPARRKAVLRLFRNWKSASNSSPVEGLEVALRRYVRPGERVSIYIFGDDYSGGSYDPVIETLTKLNSDKMNGRQKARIHAVGFLSTHSTNRFPILMREVTRLNGGTFLAMPR